jgi:hypothetical protein
VVTEIRIYFEGHHGLREGFHAFLSEIVEGARKRGLGFRLIAGEARAIRDFIKGMRDHSRAFNALLLDSECPDDGRLFERLHERADWRPPAGIQVEPGQVCWMVQIMESWFLADRPALKRFYGPGFHEASLPPNPHVEQIPKADVLSGLKAATRNTRAGEYRKGAHAPKILARVDVAQLRDQVPHCRRMFDSLLAKVNP